ncbi:D-2-hydroxyglutarate dehydrogenase YdiJ [Paraburkholderia lycopersici]|uniref:D-2-hydroxyglutarate dehydrogenase n=1 Tax=Paraburkholderia lycopersici TaxID=416944 RepID=A0A1G7AVH5_9BURK|nr:FAD-binding and (Fe-S)-binding domain-containing protein [Paraburkholderia lycopersici]SDE18839.1 FAD/FMN-containing dehydrogenase [Paraburkholderia lycopersici]
MAIARLAVGEYGNPLIRQFLHELRVSGFDGDVDTSHATRTVLATDNSIYQRYPRAVVFPRHAKDVQRIASLLGREAFRGVAVAARGGGTGTNGQSLTEGIVVDMSRHMNRILEIDPVARTARVEAGVVKDQLNAELRRHGLFFAPELSTSNRATIGGMISTDASGQGSCTYGKTRDHVLALETILAGGESLSSAPVDRAALAALCAREDKVGEIFRTARDISEREADLIRERFPDLNRCLTGYDLAHLRDSAGRFDINSVLCGSEGTLGFIVEATLNVLPVPKHAALVNIRYEGFMDALRDARALMAHRPLSIETVDSTVLRLAREDMVWQSVAAYFPDDDIDGGANGINLVEFSGDDANALRARIAAFVEHLRADASVKRLGHTIADGEAAIKRVYAMRKRAVGLLGNARGASRPQPFVEDTVVPPENLADYIAEFRALLDGFGLRYGMFGHVDAGVLHVRPALDMRNSDEAALVRPISDAVTALTLKYGGLLWGEHGKGVRSEYVPAYFGPLYPALQRLKAAFDPYNQLNPGKIATPAGIGATLLKIDATPLRGELDRRIDERVWQANADAVHCNGNGACYNFDPDDAMCPSWKATRSRVHSPKGRASLMREWLRMQQGAGADLAAPAVAEALPVRIVNSMRKLAGDHDFSHEVYDAMAGCLACKSCAGQCPVKVSVPEFRARFLELYHTRYLRPLRDYLIGGLEFAVPRVAAVPGARSIYNALMNARPVKSLLARGLGIVDSPLLSTGPWRDVLRRSGAEPATPGRIAMLGSAERRRSVIVVQDAFTRYFEMPVAAAFLELAARLDFKVFVAPYLPNGKPLHVQGFLPQFRRAARHNAAQLVALAQTGVPLVGVDPAMTLVYRQEYRKVAGIDGTPDVQLPQEWLLGALHARGAAAGRAASFRLLPHCTERSNAGVAAGLWKDVFAAAGLALAMPASGCCGMSGTYGHEARNRETSAKIFGQSWARHVDAACTGAHPQAELLATGYSCRCQVKRLRGRQLRHPVQVLLEMYR